MATAVKEAEKARSDFVSAFYPHDARCLIEDLPAEMNNAILDRLGDGEVIQKLRLVSHGVRVYVDLDYYRLREDARKTYDKDDGRHLMGILIQASMPCSSWKWFLAQQLFLLNSDLRSLLLEPESIKRLVDAYRLGLGKTRDRCRRPHGSLNPLYGRSVVRMQQLAPYPILRINGLLRSAVAMASQPACRDAISDWQDFFHAELKTIFRRRLADKRLSCSVLPIQYVQWIVPQAGDHLDRVRLEELLPADNVHVGSHFFQLHFDAFAAAKQLAPHRMRDLCRVAALSAGRSAACALWQQFNFRDYERKAGYAAVHVCETPVQVAQAADYFTSLLATAAPQLETPTTPHSYQRSVRKFWPRLLAHITLRVQAADAEAQQQLFETLCQKTLTLMEDCIDRQAAGVLWCYHYLRLLDRMERWRTVADHTCGPAQPGYRQARIHAFVRIVSLLTRSDSEKAEHACGRLSRALLQLLSHKSGFDARFVAFDMLFSHEGKRRPSITAEALRAAGLLPVPEQSVLHLMRARPSSCQTRELARRVLALRQALPRRQREDLQRDASAQMSALDANEGPSTRVIEILCALDAAVNRDRGERPPLRLVRTMQELEPGPNSLWHPQYSLHGKFTFATFRKRYAIGLMCSVFAAASHVAEHALLFGAPDRHLGRSRQINAGTKRQRGGADKRAAKRARVDDGGRTAAGDSALPDHKTSARFAATRLHEGGGQL